MSGKGDLMETGILKNSLFIMAGIILLAVIELNLVNLTDLLMLIVGFIGFAALLNGVYGLYYTYKAPED
jgi:hypothetical protein